MRPDNFHNHSTEQIIATIEDMGGEIQARIEDICLALYELRERKIGHPYFKDNIFRHFRPIAQKKILPALVWMVNGDRAKVELFCGFNETTQLAVVNNLPFPVAREKNGEIVEEKVSYIRMSPATVKRVFPGPGVVATFQDQKKALLAEIAARKPPPPRVRADPQKRCVLVGRSEVALSELKTALADLGLTLVPVEK